LDAANAARARLSADPTDVLAQSDYNFSTARIVEIVSKQDLKPWERPLICPSGRGEPWRLSLVPPDPRPQFHPSKLDFTPTDRLIFRGKLVGERTTATGLGAPVIAKGKGPPPSPGSIIGSGRDFFYGLTASLKFDGRRCEILFADPLETEMLKLDRHSYPLAADFQAPLAMTLSAVDMQRLELKGLFKPQVFEDSARLARTEPYNPKKIPVLFVHGLGNSPATFAPVLQFLRSDPRIRRNYQFWVFAYPSGLPYPMSAAILRHQLDEMRRLYPGHKDIVVIGHSMGGMISRLLLTDSKMTIWNAFFDKAPGAIPFSKEARRIMSQSLIFGPQPKVSRVIFLSASHRGSDMATDFFGRLGAKLIGNPVSQREINKEVYAYVRPDVRASGRHRLPNSIDLLDPENHFLKTVNALPLKAGVPFHSLIGDRGRGGSLDRTKPASSDGIVPYWSSHMGGARSERIIPSGHWSHLHPLGMVEIKRILNENLN
jgi:pimeloyl-ACP methyl ester carboxylesterase